MELGVLLTANVSMLGCCACVTYQTSSVLKSSTGCVEIEIHDLPGHVPCVRHGPSENLKSLLLCLGNESSHSQAYSYLTFNYHLQQTNPIKSSKHTVYTQSSITSKTWYNWCGSRPSKLFEVLVN